MPSRVGQGGGGLEDPYSKTFPPQESSMVLLASVHMVRSKGAIQLLKISIISDILSEEIKWNSLKLKPEKAWVE